MEVLNKKVIVDKLKIKLILKLQRSDAVMKRRDVVTVLNYMILYSHLLTDQEISSLKFLIYFLTAVIV